MPIIKEQEALEPISYPENSTLHNNSQNDLKLLPEIDIQPLIQKLLIKPSEEDCVKVINVEESAAVDQLPAIELAYLYKKMKFAEIKTIRTKSDEIISWYCYRSDATAPAKSKVRIPIAPTNSSVPVNSPVIPYDAHAPYINMTLKEYLYLFLYNSNKHND
ncbi:8029_t:CDS:2 [Rhizophagus irregularis]|nr:8029_t:CDS:2 [Rhizophagus irregularis]